MFTLRFFDAFTSYLKTKRTERALYRLTPHMLKDIGITQGDIWSAARRFNS